MDERAQRAILIIRLSAIGDVIMALPVAGLMRRKYPDAHIAWLVQPEAQDLLSASADIDEVIAWPRDRWRTLWRRRRWLALLREAASFIVLLRRRRFDLAVDIQGLLKSGVWARLSGAPVRIGLGSKEGSRYLMTRVIEKPRGDKLIGSEYRHLARLLDLDYREFRLDIPLDASDHAFAKDILERHRLQRYAAICPFTTRPQKHWVGERWVLLAQRLRSELGLGVLLLGGPGDRAAAEALLAQSPGLFVDATGQTRLRQAAALIHRADLVVGVDTGLTHMGTALARPTIALFGPTCPYLRTDSPSTVVLYKPLECSPCRRRPTCGGAYTCMGLLTVDELMGVARRLLRRAA